MIFSFILGIRRERDAPDTSYYQWVTFVLLFQAGCFLLPFKVWIARYLTLNAFAELWLKTLHYLWIFDIILITEIIIMISKHAVQRFGTSWKEGLWNRLGGMEDLQSCYLPRIKIWWVVSFWRRSYTNILCFFVQFIDETTAILRNLWYVNSPTLLFFVQHGIAQTFFYEANSSRTAGMWYSGTKNTS